jgi:DNA polymerase-3 subunit epsilon
VHVETLDDINDIFERMEHGKIDGRIVMTDGAGETGSAGSGRSRAAPRTSTSHAAHGAPAGAAATSGESGSVALDFTAIDFETANSSSASACAVGLARVRDGASSPRPGGSSSRRRARPFFELNIGIHGIRSRCRERSDVDRAAGGSVRLHRRRRARRAQRRLRHGVLRRACEATDAACPPYRYACSLQVARKTYDLARTGCRSSPPRPASSTFAHHDATADALACAHIMIDAARRAGADDIVELAMLLGCACRRSRSRLRVGLSRSAPLRRVPGAATAMSEARAS